MCSPVQHFKLGATEFLVVQNKRKGLQEIKFWVLQLWRNFMCICKYVSYRYVSTTLLCSTIKPAFPWVCTFTEPEALDFHLLTRERWVSGEAGWHQMNTQTQCWLQRTTFIQESSYAVVNIASLNENSCDWHSLENTLGDIAFYHAAVHRSLRSNMNICSLFIVTYTQPRWLFSRMKTSHIPRINTVIPYQELIL